MKKTICLLLAGGLVLSSQNVIAQAKKGNSQKAKPAAAPSDAGYMEKMQKAWMAYSTPGESHQHLAKCDGDWKAAVTHWMMPGDEGMKSDGSCTNKMIMGGRYQMTEFKGNFMGMPFEGMGLLAYDNAKKVFISTWVDNMGTGIMNMQGPWDAKTNSITFKGLMVDPMTGKDCKVREIFKMVDDNKQVMEMYAPTPDGKGEFKTMEIVFTR